MQLQVNATAVVAVAGVAVAGLALWKLSGVGGDVAAAVSDGVKSAANAVSPLNNDNVFAATANAAASAIAGRDETLGGALWEVDNWLWEHNPFTAQAAPATVNTGQVTGSW